jgi:hypothetical protein
VRDGSNLMTVQARADESPNSSYTYSAKLSLYNTVSLIGFRFNVCCVAVSPLACNDVVVKWIAVALGFKRECCSERTGSAQHYDGTCAVGLCA